MTKLEKRQYLEDLKPWVKDKSGRKALLKHREYYINSVILGEEALHNFKKHVVSDIQESGILKDHPVFKDFDMDDVKLLITDW
jgi:hypothetical protein